MIMTASVPMSAARMPLVIDASPRDGAYRALFEHVDRSREGTGTQGDGEVLRLFGA